MKNSTAIDPYTGETFTKTRSDKRFASTKTKNDFHNEDAKLERQKTSPYTKPLLKNRKILINILGNKPEHVASKDYLLGGGFDLNSYTGFEQKTGKITIFEFNLTIVENNNFKITKIK